MNNPEHTQGCINATISDRRISVLWNGEPVEADTPITFKVLFNGDATQFFVDEDRYGFDIIEQLGPRHYTYITSAPSFTKLAAELEIIIAEALASGELEEVEA